MARGLVAMPDLMKFHNTLDSGYANEMNSASPRHLLARLRTSARLAVLVLLIFAVKISAATACVKHDFADLGLGSDSTHAALVQASPVDDGADPANPLLGHAGCCQCSCHHATTVPPDVRVAFVLPPQSLGDRLAGPPPSAAQRLELRPPIV